MRKLDFKVLLIINIFFLAIWTIGLLLPNKFTSYLGLMPSILFGSWLTIGALLTGFFLKYEKISKSIMSLVIIAIPCFILFGIAIHFLDGVKDSCQANTSLIEHIFSIGYWALLFSAVYVIFVTVGLISQTAIQQLLKKEPINLNI